jgi:hypothetical protein
MHVRRADGLCGPHAHHRCYRYLPHPAHTRAHTHTDVPAHLNAHTYECESMSETFSASFRSQPEPLPCPLIFLFWNASFSYSHSYSSCFSFSTSSSCSSSLSPCFSSSLSSCFSVNPLPAVSAKSPFLVPFDDRERADQAKLKVIHSCPCLAE